MRLIIRDGSESASSYVANYIVQRIKASHATPKSPFVFGLPTGSSPLGVYEKLVQKYKAGEVSFENVVTFNMDEYIGIPRDHPESYHTFMWKHLFSHVNIHPRNVHILNGNAPDLEAECLSFERAIKRAGGIDLFLSGLGEDGHIAFNEPGSSLASRTRVKTLAYDTIVANSRFFDNDVSQVPKMALTVGVQTVLDAREVVAIAFGPKKANALQKCVEEGVNHMWTLSALQMHPHSMIVCDDDATLELKVKTVTYFKSIEKVALEAGVEQTFPSSLRGKPNGTARATSSPSPGPRGPTGPAVSSADGSFSGPSNHITLTNTVADQTKPLIIPSLPPAMPGYLQVGAGNGATWRSISPDLIPDCMSDRVLKLASQFHQNSGVWD